jgi:type IV secretion system protein VirD4
LPPPQPDKSDATLRPNDWTDLTTPPVPGDVAPQLNPRMEPHDSANGGIRLQPELSEHEYIATERTAQRNDELDFDRDEPDYDASRRRSVDLAMQRAAQQASLDRDDGMEL